MDVSALTKRYNKNTKIEMEKKEVSSGDKRDNNQNSRSNNHIHSNARLPSLGR